MVWGCCFEFRVSPACEGGFETRPYVASPSRGEGEGEGVRPYGPNDERHDHRGTLNDYNPSFPSFPILRILVHRRVWDRRALLYSGFPRARE